MSKDLFDKVQKAIETFSIASGVTSTCETPIPVIGYAIGAKWPEAEAMVAGLTRFEGISKTTSVNEQTARETETFYHGKTQKVNPVLARRGGRTN